MTNKTNRLSFLRKKQICSTQFEKVVYLFRYVPVYAPFFPPDEELTFQCDQTALISTGTMGLLSLLVNVVLAAVFFRFRRIHQEQLRTVGHAPVEIVDILAEALEQVGDVANQADDANEADALNFEPNGYCGIDNPVYNEEFQNASAPIFHM